MAKQQVYCEPFCIEESHQFEIHHVDYGENDPYTCFMHFHEVHEIIIFEEIDGHYFFSQGESQLSNHDVVFTPALETHNFSLTRAQKSWYIIQFLPSVLDEPQFASIRNQFEHGVHWRLPRQKMNQLLQQTRWLYGAYQEEPTGIIGKSLLQLLLMWLAQYAQPVTTVAQPIRYSLGYEKLAPVVDKFRHRACVELSLVEAAALCHLSPSHFSRQFKKVFRCNYSQYQLRHKLYSAARLLSQSSKSITDISYELGFSSPSHFIAQFKRQFAQTPRAFRSHSREQ
ncbi:helix-turn-helix transcriptional regulator [Paraferrimonas haliotis]|uniref:HTH araC/xylS-type domain-containing protein n=1 Tax=Paraferrimonas haliotis TaxID=2013866 RepID=A0AA37TYN0_9GAMM|nr:helix-turn-helix transcriptional regulator [Paraferrimonas haliotis]GLS83711.1 hypothetical protein GCM10007894_16880 [Paraferrimonas haliotis]